MLRLSQPETRNVAVKPTAPATVYNNLESRVALAPAVPMQMLLWVRDRCTRPLNELNWNKGEFDQRYKCESIDASVLDLNFRSACELRGSRPGDSAKC